MAVKKSKPIPTSRLSRLKKFGGLVGGVAAQMAFDGAAQLISGRRPSIDDLLLTPKNMLQLADKLAHLRGAAMKLGQMMSMDMGELLPEELAEILAVLRDSANPMTPLQLEWMLIENWGDDWRQRVADFENGPFAAASIGQVHKATAKDGTPLAVKIQYPGIIQAIDSDIDNLGALLKLTKLVPPQIKLDALLAEVKSQLNSEADYRKEAAFLQSYRQRVGHMPAITIPDAIDKLSNERILTMTYVEGIGLDKTLAFEQAIRDRLGQTLVELLVAELFEFRLLQSDPNLANYLYDPKQDKLVLLDFGATRPIPQNISDAYRQLIVFVAKGEWANAFEIAVNLGFFQRNSSRQVQDIFKHMCAIAAEPLLFAGAYDFGQADIAKRIQSLSQSLIPHRHTLGEPPADALFIHRKVGGLYLLLSKLRAKVNINELVAPFLK
ncbi:ABC1 kinase family protein [Corallincola platygyrae]|uniref:ABC1 kinase family protein n=1 Tax=Corallincola platygyrae TaxID=1193278 RepID=A0ABW4XLD4_9GAMM